MKEKLQEKIYLTVNNPSQLLPGASSHMSFDHTGGTIGARGSNWMLQDTRNQVNPIHCEIKWVDGAFCVVDRCGDTRINYSDEGIGAGHVAQLNDGDILNIGQFHIDVYFNEMQHELPNPGKSLGQHSVSELLGENTRQLTTHDHQGQVMPAHLESSVKPGKAEFDIMTTDNSSNNRTAVDPLAALESESQRLYPKTQAMPLDPTHFGRSPSEKTQPNFTQTAHEAISSEQEYSVPYSNSTANTASYSGQQEWQTAYAQAGDDSQHLASVPLQQGLQVNLGSMNSDAAYALLVEVGKSIKVAIEGVQKLYGDESHASHRLAMLTRTLQPIEDNPLRLKQGYEDTVRSMFSEYKSAVHLSAPAAIQESLEQARVHNVAVIQAISESLNALLKAFSPDVLHRRFERYNADVNNSNVTGEGWAWGMYKHYYDELTSSRQQGFEKLFWEVFEQAYDKAMREYL